MNTEPAARASRKPEAALGITAPAAPVVKPKTAKNPVVIYAFHCTEGCRGVYVGKHEVRKGDPRQWPSSGVGKLPSGYGGSGNWVKNARAKYGHDAFRWFLLEVVEPGQDYANAEARAVAAAREEFGERCKNMLAGGDGYDSCTIRELWTHPGFRARISEAVSQQNRKQWQRPDYRQRVSEAVSESSREAWSSPEYRATIHRETSLRKRLDAAVRRRDSGVQPHPLDNLCLESFGEARNTLPCLEPREPRSQVQRAVLQVLRLHPKGLAVPELCELLGRPVTGAGGVRKVLDNLRGKCSQPILNDGGTFVLLAPDEY